MERLWFRMSRMHIGPHIMVEFIYYLRLSLDLIQALRALLFMQLMEE